MVLNAEDLTIHAVNPAYKQLLGTRDIMNLPLTAVFSGTDVDRLIKDLKSAVRKGESVNTAPLEASINGDDGADSRRFVHTIVPISDSTGANISRLFVYSERVG